MFICILLGVLMSTNQYHGREETDKIDFKNLTPEEQKKVSRQNITKEQDDEPVNEHLAEDAKNKLDREHANRGH